MKNRRRKIENPMNLVWFLIILLLLMLGVGIAMGILLNREKNDNEALRTALQNTLSEKEMDRIKHARERDSLQAIINEVTAQRDSLRQANDDLTDQLNTERWKKAQLRKELDNQKAVMDVERVEWPDNTTGRSFTARITTKDDTTGQEKVIVQDCVPEDDCEEELCLDGMDCDTVGCLDDLLADSLSLTHTEVYRDDTLTIRQMADLKHNPSSRAFSWDFAINDPIVKKNAWWAGGHAIVGLISHIIADGYRNRADDLGPVPEIKFDGLEPLDQDNPMLGINQHGADIKPLKEKYEKRAIGFDTFGYVNDAAALTRVGRIGVRVIFGPKKTTVRLDY